MAAHSTWLHRCYPSNLSITQIRAQLPSGLLLPWSPVIRASDWKSSILFKRGGEDLLRNRASRDRLPRKNSFFSRTANASEWVADEGPSAKTGFSRRNPVDPLPPLVQEAESLRCVVREGSNSYKDQLDGLQHKLGGDRRGRKGVLEEAEGVVACEL